VNGTDRPTTLLGRTAQEVESLKSAIGHALANAHGVLDDARLPELRRRLERLWDEADGVAHLLRRLHGGDAHDVCRHRVVRVQDVIDRALAALPPVTGIVSAVRPDLPPVAGHTRRLARMVEALLSGDAGPGNVVIQASVRPGALRDERIVGIRIIDQRRRPAPSDADAEMATGIARDHGGFLGIAQTTDGFVFEIDLPAI
jgi:hypothetical protein